MHGLSPLLYNCTTITVVNVLFLPDTNQIFENVSQTFLWQNVSLYSPFHSIRSASIPGWSTSGGGLPSPQAAGWGSETGHQTPQERKQQTQGTSLVLLLLLLWYCINSGWWRLVILTQTTFEFQAEKMRAQLAALPPLCPPKLPQVSKESSMPPGGLNTGIYRRTDQLLATLLKLSSEVKVVDVTGKTAGAFQVLGFRPLWVCVCVCA